MSQQQQVTLICDMSPHETATPADRTVTLGIDGRLYELEVCAKHELQLLQTLGRYTMAARKVPRSGMGRTAFAPPRTGSIPATCAPGPWPAAISCPSGGESRSPSCATTPPRTRR